MVFSVCFDLVFKNSIIKKSKPRETTDDICRTFFLRDKGKVKKSD